MTFEGEIIKNIIFDLGGVIINIDSRLLNLTGGKAF